MANEQQAPVGKDEATREEWLKARERVLREQTLVSERDEKPGEAGGEPLQKREPTPIEELKPIHERRDIQSDGA